MPGTPTGNLEEVLKVLEEWCRLQVLEIHQQCCQTLMEDLQREGLDKVLEVQPNSKEMLLRHSMKMPLQL